MRAFSLAICAFLLLLLRAALTEREHPRLPKSCDRLLLFFLYVSRYVDAKLRLLEFLELTSAHLAAATAADAVVVERDEVDARYFAV